HIRQPPLSTLIPYTTLSRSRVQGAPERGGDLAGVQRLAIGPAQTFPQPEGPGAAIGRDLPALGHARDQAAGPVLGHQAFVEVARSEEHTSELQSRENLVCRL